MFLNYFGFRFGFEARKRGNALSKLESVLAKEQELDSIGHQAAAAAHSLGTPLSTINVIAKELRKEISNDKKYSEDIDILLEQARKCGEILKKISKREIVDDEYISNINIQDLLDEIVISFNQVTEKEIILNLKKVKKKFPIKRSPEITYGIRNFIGNAVKFSKKNVYILKIVGEPYISSKNKFLKSKSGLGLGTFIGKTLLERKKAKIDFFNGVDGGAQVEISWNISDLKS